jgi:hypothetical protein
MWSGQSPRAGLAWRLARVASVLGALLLLRPVAPAAAETHGSLGLGPALLLTGPRGAPLRYTLAGELLGARGFGGGLALHSIGGPDRLGVAALRGSLQAAAAPPRLWLRLHGELGLALDDRHPMAGAGLTTTLRVWRAAALVLDANGHLLLDGVDGTRLSLSLAVLAAVAW